MKVNAAEDLATAVRRAAEDAQAYVVEGFPEQPSRGGAPLVQLGQESAISLIAAARPKAVYLVEIAFDLDEEIGDVTESLTDLGIERLPPALAAAQRQVAEHAGEMSTTLVAFMIDGVLHTASASADWHDAFDAVVDEAVAAAKESAETHGRVQTQKVSAEINAMAIELAGHPSFNFGRVSFEKRLILATALFSAAEEDQLHEVTRRAESLFWLQQSGFRPSE